jgi:hypothetical protein
LKNGKEGRRKSTQHSEKEHRKTQFSSQIKAICWLVENCLSTKNHRKIEAEQNKEGKEKREMRLKNVSLDVNEADKETTAS